MNNDDWTVHQCQERNQTESPPICLKQLTDVSSGFSHRTDRLGVDFLLRKGQNPETGGYKGPTETMQLQTDIGK